jgi:hypothetical protein
MMTKRLCTRSTNDTRRVFEAEYSDEHEPPPPPLGVSVAVSAVPTRAGDDAVTAAAASWTVVDVNP